MKSGLENILYLKKKIIEEYRKKSKLFFLFVNFFFFPSILIIEGTIVFKLIITFEKYNLKDSLFFFIISIWAFSLFIVATSSMMLSIKKVYSLKIIESIIFRTLKNKEHAVTQYVSQMIPIIGEDLKIMLNSEDYSEWLALKNENDQQSVIKKMMLIDKSLELYPGKNCSAREYYDRANYKYKQIDKIYN